MSATTVIDRARADLAAGRAWKARDRLQGALANAPYDQAILGLLGEVAWAMDDLPAAGAAWWLTDRSVREVDAAYAALYERTGNDPQQLLRVIKPRAPVTGYPAAAVERIRWLVRDAEPWDRYRWLFEPRPHRTSEPEAAWEETLGSRLIAAAVVTVAFGPWFVGVAALLAGALWLVGVLR